MISEETFRLKAIDRIEKAKSHCGKWHRPAKDDFAFISGDQWTPEDENLLKEQNRPNVTFNYSEKMIDAVAGAEVNGRQECCYKPRGLEDAGLAELWTNAGRWVRDECSAEDEESDAFRDALICGMGWTETKMDYTENKDGMPILDRIDPTEMYWDPASIKPGLTDRRYDVHGAYMDDELIARKWPNKIFSGATDSGIAGMVRTIPPSNRYQSDDTNDDASEDKRVDQTMVWDYECVEMVPYYRVATGDGQIAELSMQEFATMKDQIKGFGLQYVKEFKREYWRAYLADDMMLEYKLSPCQVGFTRNCITGKRDRNKNIWYGLTRVMKDPQRWANKWLSQIMHIINTNSKGGLMAETGAFVDFNKAQNDWAKSDKIIQLQQGGLAKVQEKQQAPYPAGLAQLMEFALSSLPQVTGINLEALGLANRDQANVLEQSRKQAAYGLLAPVFDSLRRYRKASGKVLLDYIIKFISDGRLVRVCGPGSEQWIPLTKAPDAVTFDIVVDTSPNAPDQQQATWDKLMQIVPVMMKEGIPIPPDLLTYSPLPVALVQKWQKFIQEKQAQGGPTPEQMQQMQQQMQQLQQENVSLKQNHDDKMVMAQSKQKEMELNMQLKQAEAESNMRIRQMEAEAKIKLDAMLADAELRLTQQKQTHDMNLATHNTQGNLKIKAASAGLSPDKQGDVSMKVDTTDIADTLSEIATSFAEALQKITSAINEPKQVVRDSNGRLIGVKPVPKLVQ